MLPAWCDALEFGGPVEVWDPARVPKLYSLASCCGYRFVSPLLVAVPSGTASTAACYPELDDTFQAYRDLGFVPHVVEHAQGLQLCFQPDALAHVKETFPTAS